MPDRIREKKRKQRKRLTKNTKKEGENFFGKQTQIGTKIDGRNEKKRFPFLYFQKTKN